MPSDPISILKNKSINSRTRLSTNYKVGLGLKAVGEHSKTKSKTSEVLKFIDTPVKSLNTSRVKFDFSSPSLLEYEANRYSKVMSTQSDVKSIMDANAIALALRSQYIQDEVLIKWLDQLGQHVSLFDKKNEHLVDVLLELDWMRKSDAVIHSYSEVILNLVTAFTYYTKSVLRMIVKRFMPVLPPTIEEVDSKELNFDKLHNLLQSILKLIPL